MRKFWDARPRIRWVILIVAILQVVALAVRGFEWHTGIQLMALAAAAIIIGLYMTAIAYPTAFGDFIEGTTDGMFDD
jgi:hypothetical protein